MDPKHLNDARKLSTEAFKQATERFLAKKMACNCEAGRLQARLTESKPASRWKYAHRTTCPAYVVKEAA